MRVLSILHVLCSTDVKSLTCLRLNKLLFQVSFRPILDEPLLKCMDTVRRKLMFGHYWVNRGSTVWYYVEILLNKWAWDMCIIIFKIIIILLKGQYYRHMMPCHGWLWILFPVTDALVFLFICTCYANSMTHFPFCWKISPRSYN